MEMSYTLVPLRSELPICGRNKYTAKPLSSTADQAAGHLGMKAVTKAEGGFPQGT